MDILSLIIGVLIGFGSSLIGIWLKIKFGEKLSMIFELLRTSKEIFTVNPVLPSNMDFEVIESVNRQKEPSSVNTEKPKSDVKEGYGLEMLVSTTPKKPVNT
jgi:hypothetical protein